MDIIIKIIFILVVIVFNLHIFDVLMKRVKDEMLARVSFMLLCSFNVVVMGVMYIIMHGEYMNLNIIFLLSTLMGAVILAISAIIYNKVIDN